MERASLQLIKTLTALFFIFVITLTSAYGNLELHSVKDKADLTNLYIATEPFSP